MSYVPVCGCACTCCDMIKRRGDVCVVLYGLTTHVQVLAHPSSRVRVVGLACVCSCVNCCKPALV